MDKGNWIPISKVFVKHLPKGREYSQVEAAFSLQVDYDCENKVTVSGYAALWRWSRNKVTRFMDEMNVEIVYPENIRRKQNQKGQIAIQNMNRNRTDKGQIRVIENSDLKVSGNRSETDKGQIKDRSRYTTKEPITLKPKPKEKDIPDSPESGEPFYMTKKKRKLSGKRLQTFNTFWECFNFKNGKADAADSWLDIPQLTDSLCEIIFTAAKTEAKNRNNSDKSPKWAQGWLTSRRWEDETILTPNNQSKNATDNEKFTGDNDYYGKSSTQDKHNPIF